MISGGEPTSAGVRRGVGLARCASGRAGLRRAEAGGAERLRGGGAGRPRRMTDELEGDQELERRPSGPIELEHQGEKLASEIEDAEALGEQAGGRRVPGGPTLTRMADERRDARVTPSEGEASRRTRRLGEGPGFRKVRRELDVEEFGVNAIVIPAAIETGLHYHDEQEELYFVHRGSSRSSSATARCTLGPGGLARVDAADPPQDAERRRGRRRLRVRRAPRAATSAATASCRRARTAPRSSSSATRSRCRDARRTSRHRASGAAR